MVEAPGTFTLECKPHPVLEEAVVLVRDDQVADPVEAPLPKVGPLEGEVTQVVMRETLDQILLDAARGRDHAVNVLVLKQVSDRLSRPWWSSSRIVWCRPGESRCWQ